VNGVLAYAWYAVSNEHILDTILALKQGKSAFSV